MKKKKNLRIFAYLAAFWLNIHIALPSYYNSEFVNKFLNERLTSIVFAAASVLMIIILSYLPKIIRRYGVLNTTAVVAIAEICLTILLISSRSAPWIIIFFILYWSLNYVIYYSLDLYLERVTEEKKTGNIRGLYLTSINLAWLLSPFLAGFLIERFGFIALYFLSAVALLPVVIISLSLKESREQVIKTELWPTIKKLVRGRLQKDRDTFNILLVDFLLNFFYAIMIIYTGLYLKNEIGLSVSSIGLIYTIMLIPFVVVDYPLGKLSDKIGEKEIMIIGLVIAGISTMGMAFANGPSLVMWIGLFLMTRVGASILEMMKEVYLFKKISSQDATVLCLSRNMIPLSFIISSLFGLFFLSFFATKYIFLALGIITLLGLIPAGKLKDTN